MQSDDRNMSSETRNLILQKSLLSQQAQYFFLNSAYVGITQTYTQEMFLFIKFLNIVLIGSDNSSNISETLSVLSTIVPLSVLAK